MFVLQFLNEAQEKKEKEHIICNGYVMVPGLVAWHKSIWQFVDP